MITKCYDVFDVDSGSKLSVTLEEKTECPICHVVLRPEIKHSFYVKGKNRDGFRVHQVCFCPNCRDMFFIKHIGQAYIGGNREAYFDKMVPVVTKEASFPASISELSPAFVEIYNQAAATEANGCTEICGMGYRKALEFLVKDYLIHLHPEDEEAIKKELLGNSIKRIESTKIKALAERCTWIGNDETHYTRKHEDRDYTDMKRFVEAMVNYIVSELTFEEALSISPK
ncbi:MAG: DUF4145 domain-containing protein [Oscillibacter sp.]|nr:DUF4145 domain-containing protein [Oscillibacter sp.]